MPSVCLTSLDEQVMQSRYWDCEKIRHLLNKKWTASSNSSDNGSNNLFHIGHWKPIKW